MMLKIMLLLTALEGSCLCLSLLYQREGMRQVIERGKGGRGWEKRKGRKTFTFCIKHLDVRTIIVLKLHNSNPLSVSMLTSNTLSGNNH